MKESLVHPKNSVLLSKAKQLIIAFFAPLLNSIIFSHFKILNNLIKVPLSEAVANKVP